MRRKTVNSHLFVFPPTTCHVTWKLCLHHQTQSKGNQFAKAQQGFQNDGGENYNISQKIHFQQFCFNPVIWGVPKVLAYGQRRIWAAVKNVSHIQRCRDPNQWSLTPHKKTDSKIPPLTFSSSNYTYFVTQKKQAIGIGITQRLGSVA